MRAEKLPSGNYRCRVTWTENGVRHTESFTRPSAPEARMAAARFMGRTYKSKTDLTVGDAVDKYISVNSNVLSHSTIRGYRIAQSRIDSIGKLKIKSITNNAVQTFINDLAGRYSPKTVRNTYGLLSAALYHFQPDLALNVRLPAPKADRTNIPTKEEVDRLLANANPTLKIAIALCGFCAIRRGAICTLKHKDLDRKNKTIHVHASMIEGEDGAWHIKDSAKTGKSNRFVHCPEFVFDLIGEGSPDDPILNVRPNAISNAFRRLRNKLGIDVTFHDLRAFYASSMAILGVPDFYVADEGGWEKNSVALKKIYQRVQRDERERFYALSDKFFESVP